MLFESAVCIVPSPASEHSCSQYNSDDKRAKEKNAADDEHSIQRTLRDFCAVFADLLLLSLVLWPTPLALLLSERIRDGLTRVAHKIELFMWTACVFDAPPLIKGNAATAAAT